MPQSPLEDLYQDPAWEESGRKVWYSRASRLIWWAFGIIFLANFLITVVARLLDKGTPEDVFKVAATYLIVVLLCCIPATILALFLANIPFKKLDYGDRFTLWIGGIMVAFLMLITGILGLIIFGLAN